MKWGRWRRKKYGNVENRVKVNREKGGEEERMRE
jgi:hypothetical protein